MDPTAKATQQLEQTALLLDQLCLALRTRQIPTGLTAEQRAAIARAAVALETYVDYVYPREPSR